MESIIGVLLRRPVAVAAFYILFAALAAVAVFRLPVALLPSLSYPSLVIWTAYPDAPPTWVQRALTTRIEQAVSGTTGLVRLSSRSQLGGSVVRADFGWNTQLDLAALQLRQQLDRIAATLPESAARPLVLRIDPSDRPILIVAVSETSSLAQPPVTRPGSGTRQDLLELKKVVRDVVIPQMEQVAGVSRVQLTGGYEREIEILLLPEKAAVYGIETTHIIEALQADNVSLAGGTVRRGPFRYAVEVSSALDSSERIADTLVSKPGQPPITLREVATIRDSVAHRRGLVRLNGHETILLLVERRPDANTLRTAANVREALEVQKTALPGIRFDILADESITIKNTIESIVQAIGWGAVLAFLVLVLFLRRRRTLLAFALTVLLSLALSLVLFEILDISLNLISLAGLALGGGMLVDNAIVVIENIARLSDRGMTPDLAARRGTAEVAMAVTASTLTTMAVFLPLTFVEGLAGQLFRDQSLAVVCSLSASLVVALTVVPLIASREVAGGRRFSIGGGRLLMAYERTLACCLQYPGRVLSAVALFLAATAYLALKLPREAIPPTREAPLKVELELPPDADVELVASRSMQIESAMAKSPQVRWILADLGERDEAHLEVEPRPMYRGDLTLFLSDADAAEPTLRQLRSFPLPPDVAISAHIERTPLERLLIGEESGLLIDVIGEPWRAAEDAAEKLLATLQRKPELTNVARSYSGDASGYQLSFNREAMVRFGLGPEALETFLEIAAGGKQVTLLQTVNEQIPVVLHNPAISSVEQLMAERLPLETGTLPLHTFLEARPTRAPAVLVRDRQASVVRLTADIAADADLGTAIRAVEEGVAQSLPVGFGARVGGASEAFRSTLRAVRKSLLLSLLLVYLILAAQFNSLRLPGVILAAVPLAAGGVVLALAITGQSWNLMSLTGCVVLVGIAINDAIIKVDFIHRRRLAGQPLETAIREAGRDRVRPILMTTFTTVLALVPLAAGYGTGANLHAPTAVAIIGGLLCASILTLIVVPVLYAVLNAEKPLKPGVVSGILYNHT